MADDTGGNRQMWAAINDILGRARRLASDGDRLSALQIALVCLSREQLTQRLGDPEAFQKAQAAQVLGLDNARALALANPDFEMARISMDMDRAMQEEDWETLEQLARELTQHLEESGRDGATPRRGLNTRRRTTIGALP